jgi:LPXTG-motif cell wall-anchored protein
VRKFLALAAFVVVSLAPAGAALAQDAPARDPFVPLIQPSPAATGDGTAVPTDPTVPVDPAPDPDEPLPNTGSSTISWIGLGYVLIALGGGAVVLSKVLRPIRLAPR